MSISSMTGFARAQGFDERCAWTWEVKSVNGRGRDLRCRLPAGFESLEAETRDRAQKCLQRGNISLTLSVNWTRAPGEMAVNEDVLDQVLALAGDIRQRLPDAAPPRVDGLLAVRGVVEAREEPLSEEARQALDGDILAALDEALQQAAAMRRDEGARLAQAVGAIIDDIEGLLGQVGDLAAAQPAAIRERLAAQVQALLEDVPALSEDRLAQEAALLMTKADVREELDRLAAHVEAARALLDAGGAVGRKLDFLCQEFNREANTLCAKSGDGDMTRLGLDLKSAIDQMREQVQNIE